MRKLENRICFVIINYNSFIDTKECINSLLNQTNKAFDILIIDNNSMDNSLENLQAEFPDLIFIKNNENYGFTGGCNTGAKYCIESVYDYVFLLNNDTIAHPQMMEHIYSFINIKPDISILTGKILYKDIQNKIWYAGGYLDNLRLKGVHKFLNDEQNKNSTIKNSKVSFVSGCMMLIKADVFKTIGYLDDFFFANYEDVDYCIRANLAGLEMFYLPDAIIWHKVSPNFISNNRLIKFTPFLYYLKARNKIYLIKKYSGRKSFYCPFIFNIPKLLKYILGFLFLLRFKELKYLFSGFYDGFFSKPVRFNK